MDKAKVIGKNLANVRAEMAAGMGLTKCRQCGCMAGGLDNLALALPVAGGDEARLLAAEVSGWREQMRPVQYACLGCEHCYPAVAQNAFAEAFPALPITADLSCDFRIVDQVWPPVPGDYYVLDSEGPVAVSTLAAVDLAREIAERTPDGLAIVGKTETENIGLDKIIKNTITSATLRFLIVAGQESRGHLVGQTLLALAENGIDGQGRVRGARGKRPVLRNVSARDVQAFREQVQVVDMIGCTEPEPVMARIGELSAQAPASCGCGACHDVPPVSLAAAPSVVAGEPGQEVRLDRAGYFVILPLADKGMIRVEHYAYDNALLRVIEGESAREIYRLIIDKGWVTVMSHAAYLGKELAKAELTLQYGIPYVQDGA